MFSSQMGNLMPITYLFLTFHLQFYNLPTYLNVLPTNPPTYLDVIPTYYIPSMHLPTYYLLIYLPTTSHPCTYLHTTYLFTYLLHPIHPPTYILPTYLPTYPPTHLPRCIIYLNVLCTYLSTHPPT
jgi:hypothetical protein